MSSVRAFVGQPAADIETPALVIDLDAMERNLTRMAEFAKAHGVRLRPHAKTHKCAALARLQIAGGAVGVCVQKVDEAEALAAAGIGDIYLSNEVIDPIKLQRVATLAGRIRLAIAVDSALGVERLAAALAHAGTRADVFVEIDVGHGRCGIPPVAAGALAHQVVSNGLSFAGLQAYHGRAQHLRGAAEREAVIRHAVGLATHLGHRCGESHAPGDRGTHSASTTTHRHTILPQRWCRLRACLEPSASAGMSFNVAFVPSPMLLASR